MVAENGRNPLPHMRHKKSSDTHYTHEPLHLYPCCHMLDIVYKHPSFLLPVISHRPVGLVFVIVWGIFETTFIQYCDPTAQRFEEQISEPIRFSKPSY